MRKEVKILQTNLKNQSCLYRVFQIFSPAFENESEILLSMYYILFPSFTQI